MSRTLQDIQKEYSEAAVKLGAESYTAYSLGEELERLQGNINQLLRKMQGLVKESNKLAAKQPQPVDAPVALPVEAAVEAAKD